MTVKELVADLIGCAADSNVVLEDDVEFTDEYGKVSGTCYQIEKVVRHGRSVSLHFDNRQHFMREQEPKTGHWIKTREAVMGEGYMWFCSNCKHRVYQDSSRPYPSENYCPNCGAKMESEE